ncbi:arsenic resistance N-acetyltransferase ArsN2 [Mucilaginibacter sp. BT774]|uniref:arsenic resistance N-acetyltransferase ArsN2 n=1 Tax=Mucilaginibacter sp. BT774 TaxID=3062276 RepID=UPI002676BF28|nr:arsenic resistance N-acetyltransferase ArsN2 [Mucilaginibacter sp. BT774]MDO3624583.1 arsenic resistance N-acetyltransferase ArsN2 [Mucilaginibacter sp. BT774]
MMQIIKAINYRENIIALLSAEKLPSDDLPSSLDNFLVMTEGDELVGVVGLEMYGGYGLLRSLAVNPDYRSKNIAGKLVEEIEKFAVSKDLKSIILLTETAPDYFSRKGYSRIARAEVPAEVQQSSEFRHVCPQSAIAMKKDL